MGSTYLLHFNCKFAQDHLEFSVSQRVWSFVSLIERKPLISLHAILEGKCVVEMLYQALSFLFLVEKREKKRMTNFCAYV